jgi:hypothetical protein
MRGVGRFVYEGGANLLAELGRNSNTTQNVILRACDFIDLSREVFDFKQNRHPERSASPTYSVTAHSVGAQSKDLGRRLSYPPLLGAFQPPEPENMRM